MPKPLMMMIAVEEIAFGSVFRRLKNMDGVISLDIDAEPDKKSALSMIEPGGIKRYKGGGGRAKNAKGSDAGGDSAKCIALSVLEDAKGSAVPSKILTDAIEAAGKSRKTFANVSYHLRKGKLARKGKKGWVLTPAGKKFLHTECRIGGADV